MPTIRVPACLHPKPADHRGVLNHEVILSVEDDIYYAELLKTTLEQAGFKHRFFHACNGEEGVAYLCGKGKYADRTQFPLPCLVLADLKMPRLNGFELLQWIRQESPYPHLPVVVLTSSDELSDIRKAYQLGANSFLVKSPNIEDLKEMMKMLNGFWLKYNVGPR